MRAPVLVLVLVLALLPAQAGAQGARPAAPAPDRAILLKRAASALSAGRRIEAMALLRDAADRFQSVRALVQLADLQSAAGDAKGSMDSLARARSRAPNAEGVLAGLARGAGSDPLSALEAWEPLARIYPGVADYHAEIGAALAAAGDLPGAVSALRRAEVRDPGRTSTLVALGNALNDLALFSDAKPYLLRSLERVPDDDQATAALAECEVGLGDLASAEAHARQVLARSAAHATANLVLGMVLLAQENPAEARPALEKAVTTGPGSAKVHHQLSLACAALGDGASAARHEDEARRRVAEREAMTAKIRSEVGDFEGDEP